MKKLRYTLLLGVVLAFLAINVVKPNSGLDPDTLFKMVDQANEKVDNYIQKNNFSVTVSKIDPVLDKEPDEKSFIQYYGDNLLHRKDEETSEEEKKELKDRAKAAQISRYADIQRYELFYDGDGFEKRYASDYVARNDEAVQSFYIEENGKIKSSLNNEIIFSDDPDFVQPLKPLTEDDEFMHIFDYKKITDELKEISKFVAYTEIDKFYVFKKEFEDIRDSSVQELVKRLEVDKDLENYDKLSVDDMFNGSWDKTYALINYNLDSTDMGFKKIMFTIILEKDGVRTTVTSFKEFEQFNILSDISLPKQLRESR